MTEQHAAEQPRRILTEDEYDRAYQAARDALGVLAARIGRDATDDAVTAALATVGVLAPPPEPEPDTCSAMWPDPDGTWQQCTEDPGHDGESHDGGDWVWPADAPNAIPPRDDDAEPPTITAGDQYDSRKGPARTVTVTRVWTADDGHTAVAYEWRERIGQSFSACPLDVFHRTYRPAKGTP